MRKIFTLLIVGFSLFSCADSDGIKETNEVQEEFPKAKNYARPLPLTNFETELQKRFQN